MDRELSKQKPGAATQVEDTHDDTVGKATLSGRLGGEHAAGAAPAAATPKAKPSEPPAAAAKALTISSRAEARAPAAGATRTVVGVGEIVTFTGSEGGDWTSTGGKSLGGADNTEFRWSAPGSPGSYTITLTVGDRKATKTIVVVAPNAIYFKKAGDLNPSSGQGVGMSLAMDIGPKTVSFGAVQIKEKPGPASGVWGYFAKQQKAGASLSHVPKGSWTWVNENNTTERPDEAFFDGWPAPWEPGGMTWSIPNLWSLVEEGGNGTEFARVTQTMHIADTKGTSVLTKGGVSASRSASK